MTRKDAGRQAARPQATPRATAKLATNSSSLPDAGKTDQVFTLDNGDIKDIKNAKGKKSVPLKIVTTFTGDAYQEQITTKFRLDR